MKKTILLVMLAVCALKISMPQPTGMSDVRKGIIVVVTTR